ncbi:MAG: LPS export ABC transporter periplasmic protein LptC [Francisellaceae bacterium]
MFFSKRSVFFTLGLGLVIGSSSWLAIKSAEQQLATSNLPQDFIINKAKDVSYTRINEQGYLTYDATAKTAERMQSGNSRFAGVNAWFYSSDPLQKPWHVTSDYAKVTQNNNKITLFDHVVVKHAASGRTGIPVEITTDHANYWNNKDFLTTDAWVVISQPDTRNNTVAKGLIAYPDKGQFKLLSHVRSYYAQNAEKQNTD